MLIGTYSPATRDSSRDDFRLGYLDALDARVRNLVAEGKQVVLTGDLNVIRSELDTCNLREVLRKEGMSVEEWMEMPSRRMFNQLVFDGNVAGKRDEGRGEPVLHDLTRMFHPSRQGMFTCWDTKRNTRPANNGSRIDYILCSTGIKDWFTGSDIQEGLMGSDHCPVYAIIGDTVRTEGKETSVLDLMNPSGMFREGRCLREWSAKELLPLSAKLIPEFDRRRNIRDMFMKKTVPKPTPVDPPSSTATEVIPTPDPSQFTPPSQVHEDPPSQSQTRPLALSNATKTDASRPDKALPSKRQAEARDPPATKRSLKRTKTNDTDPSGTKTNNKQSTLTGFFKPKQPVSKPTEATGVDGGQDEGGEENNGTLDQSSEKKVPTAGLDRCLAVVSEDPDAAAIVAPAEGSPSEQTQQRQAPTSSLKTSAIESSGRVFDPIETKEAWSKFSLGKRVVPKCEHGEPCIILQTKKPGVNCGKTSTESRLLLRQI